MNLVIDIGNTLSKVAIFDNEELLFVHSYPDFGVEDVQYYFKKYRISRAIISSVGANPEELAEYLRLEQGCRVHVFDHHTPLPFENRYATPHTLGKDRMAGVTGAYFDFPGQSVLVIDAGTCITYDVLTSKGVYLGGAISPGIRLRYKAMNTFTKNLPLLETAEEAGLTGTDTAGSMHSGVLNGVVQELDGMIDRYADEHSELQVVVTGGDLIYFDKKLKNNIFARPNIVITGLNKILDYYFEKKNNS